MFSEKQAKELNIIPDILFNAPLDKYKDTIDFKVIYNQNEVVNFGSKLNATQVLSEPEIQIKVNDHQQPHSLFKAGHYFTVVMIDPDAPSRRHPTHRSYLHYIQTNMPLNEKEGYASSKEGTYIAKYATPSPPKDSGPHRYVFVLYEHSNKLSYSKSWLSTDKEGRQNFNLELWAKEHNLNEPIALTCFEHEYEPMKAQ
ncbi:hypothetical protein ABK040_011055 [Willaertia magna]